MKITKAPRPDHCSDPKHLCSECKAIAKSRALRGFIARNGGEMKIRKKRFSMNEQPLIQPEMSFNSRPQPTEPVAARPQRAMIIGEHESNRRGNHHVTVNGVHGVRPLIQPTMDFSKRS